ncbi:MAG: aminotransferase class I/II-fold pyridoxal phosphate-dependent enzyme [Planctomycetota bacterium]
MEVHGSKRLNSLGAYAFAAINEKVDQLRAQGLTPVDFGVGDPTLPTPEIVRQATIAGVERWKSGGYPPYVGTLEFRQAVADWNQRRFGVTLDPQTEICSSIGSKEGIFNFPEAILDPGDIVLVPDPGYPPYARGTLFAEGESFYVPILAENDFLPDLDSIPADIAARAKIFWLTQPNSPTGKVASADYMKRWIKYCQDHQIIAASDEAYTEIYFGDPPHSALEFDRDGVVVFQSLSKRSAMTGYRVGWVAGDERILALFRKVKTNLDSGTPLFVQDAAVAALSDETHVADMRGVYRELRDLLVDAFVAAGCPRCEPEAAMYIWQRAPEGVSAMQFAEALLDPRIAAVTVPGELLCLEPSKHADGCPFVRLALVPTVEDCQRVATAIREVLPEVLAKIT